MLVPTTIETQVDSICANLAVSGGVRVYEYPVGSSMFGFGAPVQCFLLSIAVGMTADAIRSVRSPTTGTWPYLLNVTEESGFVIVKFELVGAI